MRSETTNDATARTTEVTETRSHRHDLDPLSLAFGVVFVILGAAFLAGLDVSTLDAPNAWAAGLTSVGVLLLALGARRQKR